jgi:hypothetical protein
VVPGWKRIIRSFAERGFASGAIGDRLRVVLRDRLKVAAPLLTEDRRVLEQIIFAHYRDDSRIKTVLFVGCHWYTAHYQWRYFAAHDYWTIDPDPTRRRFGARRHVVARLEELGQHFPTGFFDLIVCNGVYGWGLDRGEDCDIAMSECYLCLAPAGHLVLGWNDLPQRDPVPLANVTSLSQFLPYSFPAFGTWQYLTDTPHRHTYRFYQKNERRESTAPESRR